VPSALEMQVIQKERLFDLLMLQKTNPDREINGLKLMIKKAKAGMSKEDVAYVEKLVAEEDD